MQNVYSKANGGCPSSLTTGKAYTLTDQRDSRTYYVARLADGNCWMLQNLRVGQSTSSITLRSELSDVSSSGFTLNGKTTDCHWDNPNQQYYNDNSQYCCTSNYGCYYNWYTSTAGYGKGSVTSGSVAYSVCPAGWTLPSPSQFQSLYNNYNSLDALLVKPYTATENNGQFAPGLLLGGNGASYQGTYTAYWSNSAVNSGSAYSFSIDLRNGATTIDPVKSSNGKYGGYSLRCLLK